jgi:hypothetical protein
MSFDKPTPAISDILIRFIKRWLWRSEGQNIIESGWGRPCVRRLKPSWKAS